jgi:hypothetical protein
VSSTGSRARLEDDDLALCIPKWHAWLADRVGEVSQTRYVVHVRTLMPEGRPFYRSAFTSAAVAQWLASRVSLVRKRRPADKGSRRQKDPEPLPASGPTKRRYLAALRSFAMYLVEIGVLVTNPVRDVKAPSRIGHGARSSSCPT